MTLNKKKLTPIFLISIFFLMLGLSFAAVPLYELFCRVTGFAGTTQVVKNKEVPKIVIDQVYKLRFDTNVGNQLEWNFFPEKNTLEPEIDILSNKLIELNGQKYGYIKGFNLELTNIFI